jgi:acyl transferase domain-containing protein
MKGSMVAVGLDRNSAFLEISTLNLDDRVRVACINSPESVTMSGDEAAIDEIMTRFQCKGVFVRKLKTGGKAYHSHHMVALGQEYEDLLSRAAPSMKEDCSASTVQMFSSVTGKLVDGATVNSSKYWRTNLESPVLFQDALEILLQDGKWHLIEIGPHSALELPVKQISAELQLGADHVRYSSTLSRDKDDTDCMLTLSGTLYLHGHDIIFEKVNAVASLELGLPNVNIKGKIICDLPNYKWNYGQLLWNEPRKSSEFRNRKYLRHDLLGSSIHGESGELHSWRNVLHEKDVPWLKDHKLNGEVVFPGAGYIAMALEALHQVLPGPFADTPTFIFRQVKFLNALILSHASQVEVFTQFKRVQLSETSQSMTWWHFEISSYIMDVSTMHANGQICLGSSGAQMGQIIDFPQSCMKKESSTPWYSKLSADGFDFGPSFQSMVTTSTPISKNIAQASAEILIGESEHSGNKPESHYVMHPLAIDSMLQTMLIASASGVIDDLNVKVPFSIGHLEIGNTAIRVNKGVVRATSEVVGFGTINAKAEFVDKCGEIVAQMSDVRAIANQGGLDQDLSSPERTPMLRIIWKPEFSSFSTGRDKNFSNYLDRFSAAWSKSFTTYDIGRLAGALDLLAHSNPNLRILEIGDTSISGSFLQVLDADTKFKRFQSYTQGLVNGDGILEFPEAQANSYNQAGTPVDALQFDVILFSNVRLSS